MQNLSVRALQEVNLSAREDRLVNEGFSEGLLAPATEEFKVKPQASPGMSVRVGSGTPGDRYVVPVSGQGTYIVANLEDAYIGSGNTDVAIANGDSSNPRIDGIDLRVYDDEADSSGSNKAEIVVTQGTPASTPSAPAVPSGAVRLAEVTVDANESTSIQAGDIADRRKAACAVGGTLVCTSSTRPSPAYAGQRIVETDTMRELAYDGSAWLIVGGKIPRAHAYLTNQAAIPASTATSVPFNADRYSSGIHDADTSQTDFTIQTGEAGLYRLTANLIWLGHESQTGTRAVWFEVNSDGTRFGWTQDEGVANITTAQVVSIDLELAEGDVLTCEAWQDLSGAWAVEAGSWMSVVYLAPGL